MFTPALTVLAEGGGHVPVVDPSSAGSLALPLVLVVALPALGAAVLLLGGRRTDKWGHWLGVAMVAVSFALSLYLFVSLLGSRRDSDRQVARRPLDLVPERVAGPSSSACSTTRCRRCSCC